MAPRPLAGLWRLLTSLQLTLVCLSLLMVLVVCCTLAQVRLGTFAAVDVYMRSFFVYAQVGPWRLPYFPGGASVGLVLMANLVAAQFSRLERSWRKAGIWVVHVGLILLFAGEFVTGAFQVESQMAIDEGATVNFSESPRDTEIALIDSSPADYDEVHAIPEAAFRRRKEFSSSRLPFTVLIRRYFQNAELGRPGQAGLAPSLATAGVGTGVALSELAPVSNDNERNQVAAEVELRDGEKSLGVWLLSNGLGAPQTLSYAGRQFTLVLRPRRFYLPFSLTLKDFTHDVYPGTDIPKNFSSLVRLVHPERHEDRDVLIYMNSPLRYGGKAFYQASFGKEDTMSVLQVVENPGWLIPYLSCILVAAGLLWHFLARLKTAGVA